MILVHESTEHWQHRGDDLCVAGRDSAQLRIPIRSSVARGVVGGTGDELSSDGSRIGRWGAKRRVLGASVRPCWVRRVERRRSTRASTTFERGGAKTGGTSPASQSDRFRPRCPTLGWPALVGFLEATNGCDLACATVPATVSSDGFPTTQTTPSDSRRRSTAAGCTQKNSEDRPLIPLSTFGRWMRFIFSSMEVVAECGCHQRCSIRFANTHQRAKASVTSVPSGFETANSVTPNPVADLMPKLAGLSFAAFVVSVLVHVAGWWSSQITPSTTMRRCMLPGAKGKNRNFGSIFCLRIVLNSTPSSVSGNCFGDSACTTGTLRQSLNSQSPSMHSLPSGRDRTLFSNDSVLSSIMRNHLRRRV